MAHKYPHMEQKFDIGDSIYSISNDIVPISKCYKISGAGDLSFIQQNNKLSKTGYGFSIKNELGKEFFITYKECEKYFILYDEYYKSELKIKLRELNINKIIS